MISVSYLKSKFSKEETLKKIEESEADLIHVDLMDGLYVPNKNFTIENCIEDLKNLKKPLDIHLMVNNPLIYIKDLVKLNCKIITFHLDSTSNNLEVINYIKNNHIKVGVAINPQDDINNVLKYIDLIDYVLIMSVKPGKGGQEFITDVLEKVNYLKDKKVLIGIDGGVNDKTIKYIKKYPIDIIVSGSFICLSDNFNEQINKLK